MLFLFGLTLFLSGFLLFLVEPMFAKMALPKLGGTPGVWNVCMVFYQAALLAGYAYSHELAKRFSPRRTALAQMGLILAAFFALPIRIPETLSAPAQQNPTLWLLGLLTLVVGLPFLVLSTFSSILQTWYASSSRAASNDPYVLYSASNLGSVLGLFAYPVLMERHLGLTEQSHLWKWGYVVLTVLTLGCAISVWCMPERKSSAGKAAPTETAARPTRLQKLKWLVLAFIPSSLMLGVTSALTTELPPIPLLWVIPLAIYLVSFILVFARKPIGYHRTIVETLPILLLVVAFPIVSKGVFSPVFLIVFDCVTLFFACMACHGELALSRPPAAYLTRFYLCVSTGGVLGGLFNAIIAPVLFKSVLELPIALFLLALAISRMGSRTQKDSINKWDFALPAALGLGIAVVALWLRSTTLSAGPVMNLAFFAVPMLICFSFSKRPIRFALGFGALLFASGLYSGQYGRVMLTERSFYGVYRVSEDGTNRQLLHGSTIQGMQSLDPTRARQPLSYYYETGPIGQIFRSASTTHRLEEVAVVGLGAGSLACYSEPWRAFTFYEIDPTVERIARNPRYFTFLRDCAPQAKIVIGDARLALKSAPAGKYNLIVLDAFSSDTVPVHLVTREAIELYLEKLADQGILAFNVSNRYLDFRRVLGELARNLGLASAVQEDANVDPQEQNRGKFSSRWILLARQPSDLARFAPPPNWQEIQNPSGSRLWTDDYSSLLEIIHWN